MLFNTAEVFRGDLGIIRSASKYIAENAVKKIVRLEFNYSDYGITVQIIELMRLT